MQFSATCDGGEEGEENNKLIDQFPKRSTRLLDNSKW